MITEGPWEVGYIDKNGQAVVSAEHTEICTCWHHCVGSVEKQMHANAFLISSAPDFAKVAPDAADILDQYAGYIATVKSSELECHPYLPHIEQVSKALRAAMDKAERVQV